MTQDSLAVRNMILRYLTELDRFNARWRAEVANITARAEGERTSTSTLGVPLDSGTNALGNPS